MGIVSGINHRLPLVRHLEANTVDHLAGWIVLTGVNGGETERCCCCREDQDWVDAIGSKGGMVGGARMRD